MNKTSIIILTYNHLDYTKDCIQSIRKYTDPNSYEIIVVDNLSTDGTREWLLKQNDLKVVFNNSNVGFPKGCNEGIKLAQKNNDLLLLNNDTIVTENWLTNLKICLYSDPLIGAVGPVCNQNENNQGVTFTYDNFLEMQKLARANNISNSARWEEKVFLIGFCLLIKRTVWEKLKELDENFTPGYIEDNDLSLRILKLGYHLYLCHDVFIHHYLGTSFRQNLDKFYPVLNKNRAYFYSKWHFNTWAFDEIKSASFPLTIESPKVLDWRCGIGTNLLAMKYKYKFNQIAGLEPDNAKRKIANLLFKTYASKIDIKEHDYDLILLGTELENVADVTNFILELKSFLSPKGMIIGEFHNASNIKNIYELINGHSFSEIHPPKNWFTIQDMDNLLKQNGFTDIDYYFWYETYSEEEQKLLHNLEANPYLSYTYVTFRAKVKI